jgi:hypothetical protein
MPDVAAYAESSAYSGASTNTHTGGPTPSNHERWDKRVEGQQGRGEGGRRVRGAEVVLGEGVCGSGSGLQSLCSVDTDESQDENRDGGKWDRGDRAEGEGIASGGIRFRGRGGGGGGGVGIEREFNAGVERELLGHMTTEHNAWLVRQLLLPSISRLLAE